MLELTLYTSQGAVFRKDCLMPWVGWQHLWCSSIQSFSTMPGTNLVSAFRQRLDHAGHAFR